MFLDRLTGGALSALGGHTDGTHQLAFALFDQMDHRFMPGHARRRRVPAMKQRPRVFGLHPFSYTHLTLPNQIAR